MKNSKKKPFTISRLPPKNVPSPTAEKSPDQQLKRTLTPIDPIIERQNQILAYVLFLHRKLTNSIEPKQSSKIAIIYSMLILAFFQSFSKDMLTLISSIVMRNSHNKLIISLQESPHQKKVFIISKEISNVTVLKELRSKYPLYFILVSICKVKGYFIYDI